MRATSACDLFHRCIDRRGGEEWYEFHRRYHPHVKKAVRQALVQGGFAVPEPDLEEIVQDLYCRLLASGRPFRGRSETELWCYLGRIARNLALDRRRAARARKRWLEAAALDPGSPGCGATGFRPLGRTPRERAEELVSSEPSPEERCVLNDCRRIFVARCREVVRGERARKILRLAILEGWSSREIARRLGGMTPNQVDVLLCRLKKRLAKEGIRLPRRRGGCKSPSPPARGPTGGKRR